MLEYLFVWFNNAQKPNMTFVYNSSTYDKTKIIKILIYKLESEKKSKLLTYHYQKLLNGRSVISVNTQFEYYNLFLILKI